VAQARLPSRPESRAGQDTRRLGIVLLFRLERKEPVEVFHRFSEGHDSRERGIGQRPRHRGIDGPHLPRDETVLQAYRETLDTIGSDFDRGRAAAALEEVRR